MTSYMNDSCAIQSWTVVLTSSVRNVFALEALKRSYVRVDKTVKSDVRQRHEHLVTRVTRVNTERGLRTTVRRNTPIVNVLVDHM